MQHVNSLIKHVELKEKNNSKKKLANYKSNARAAYNVVNQLLDKFSGNHPPITSTAQACQFSDIFFSFTFN